MKRTQKIPKIWMSQRSKKNFRKIFPGVTEIKLEVTDSGYAQLYLRYKKTSKVTIKV